MTTPRHREIPWRGLLVKGEAVTPEQAVEIICRTTYLGFGEGAPGQGLRAAFGIQDDGWGSYHAAADRTRNLDLVYLRNERLYSRSFDGTHGWVDWDGTVKALSFNVGQHPYHYLVLEELERIAQAFPFLNAEFQLLNQEFIDAEAFDRQVFAVYRSWSVENGKVRENADSQLLWSRNEIRAALARLPENPSDAVEYPDPIFLGRAVEWISAQWVSPPRG